MPHFHCHGNKGRSQENFKGTVKMSCDMGSVRNPKKELIPY